LILKSTRQCFTVDGYKNLLRKAYK